MCSQSEVFRTELDQMYERLLCIYICLYMHTLIYTYMCIYAFESDYLEEPQVPTDALLTSLTKKLVKIKVALTYSLVMVVTWCVLTQQITPRAHHRENMLDRHMPGIKEMVKTNRIQGQPSSSKFEGNYLLSVCGQKQCAKFFFTNSSTAMLTMTVLLMTINCVT